MIAWIGLTISAYSITRMVELIYAHRNDESGAALLVLLATGTIIVAGAAAW